MCVQIQTPHIPNLFIFSHIWYMLHVCSKVIYCTYASCTVNSNRGWLVYREEVFDVLLDTHIHTIHQSKSIIFSEKIIATDGCTTNFYNRMKTTAMVGWRGWGFLGEIITSGHFDPFCVFFSVYCCLTNCANSSPLYSNRRHDDMEFLVTCWKIWLFHKLNTLSAYYYITHTHTHNK